MLIIRIKKLEESLKSSVLDLDNFKQVQFVVQQLERIKGRKEVRLDAKCVKGVVEQFNVRANEHVNQVNEMVQRDV
jgi:hypothetical protein